MIEARLFKRKMGRDFARLPQHARAPDYKSVPILLADNWHFDRVFTMGNRIDNGLIDRDPRILRFVREAPVRVSMLVCLEEGRFPHESAEIANLLRNRPI